MKSLKPSLALKTLSMTSKNTPNNSPPSTTQLTLTHKLGPENGKTHQTSTECFSSESSVLINSPIQSKKSSATKSADNTLNPHHSTLSKHTRTVIATHRLSSSWVLVPIPVSKSQTLLKKLDLKIALPLFHWVKVKGNSLKKPSN